MADLENYFSIFCDIPHCSMDGEKIISFLTDFIRFFPQSSKLTD